MPGSRLITIISHVCGWLLFLISPLLFIRAMADRPMLLTVVSWPYLKFALYFIFLFYINSMILVPVFLGKGKTLLYGLLAAALFCSVYFVRPFETLLRANRSAEEMPRQIASHIEQRQRFGKHPPFDLMSVFMFLGVMGFSMALAFSRRWQKSEQRAARAEAEKAQAELSFLKGQINPHFLYNTLNNIYTLSVLGSGQSSEHILNLSRIMRYVSEDAGANTVSLFQEINCIENYIGLQKLRIAKNVIVDYEQAGSLEHKHIAPLVLMSFIENIFKYGISTQSAARIIVRITVEDKKLTLFTQNSVHEGAGLMEDVGIGMKSAAKRLELLYAGKYKLDTRNEKGLFTVNLVMEL